MAQTAEEKAALSPQQVTELRQQITAGANKSKLAKELGISRETLYQYLKPIQP